MDLFFDNDIVIKLAEYELLDTLLDLLNDRNCKTFILPTLGFVAGLNNTKRATKVFSSIDKVPSIQRLIDRSSVA